MPDIRYVCLSDMHLGEEDSLFTNVKKGKIKKGESKINTKTSSPVLKHLTKCLEELISKNKSKKKPILILNGDILELALSFTNEAAMVFDQFINTVMPVNNELFEKAMRETIQQQNKIIGISRYIGLAIKEVWKLQHRLQARKPRYIMKLAQHPRFRAAYDLLLLREKSGEPLKKAVQWWTEFQQADETTQQRMISGLR